MLLGVPETLSLVWISFLSHGSSLPVCRKSKALSLPQGALVLSCSLLFLSLLTILISSTNKTRVLVQKQQASGCLGRTWWGGTKSDWFLRDSHQGCSSALHTLCQCQGLGPHGECVNLPKYKQSELSSQFSAQRQTSQLVHVLSLALDVSMEQELC